LCAPERILIRPLESLSSSDSAASITGLAVSSVDESRFGGYCADLQCLLDTILIGVSAPCDFKTDTFHERVEPSSVSVYDDAGYLVSQYLRGVSFPVTKQGLLRLARSSGAKGSLLHSIEAMAEGNYRNADEVLRALGSMAHLAVILATISDAAPDPDQ
jgi:hypothetical protein